MDSNVENILRNMIDGTVEYDPPRSRVEEALIELKETLDAGAGGGTVDEVARNCINTHADNSTIHVSEDEKAAWNAKAEQSDFADHAGNMFMHTTESEKDKIYSAVSQDIFYAAVSGFRLDIGQLENHAENADIHVTAEEKSEWNAKAEQTDITAHSDNSEIHVTAEEKAAWSAKADLSDIPERLQYVNYLGYVSDVENILNNTNYSDSAYECVITTSEAAQIGLPSCWWQIKYFRHTDNNGFGIQIAFPIDGPSNLPRFRTSHGSLWDDWKLLADGGNSDTVDGLHSYSFMQWLGLPSETDFMNDANYKVDYHCNIADGTLIDLPTANWYHIVYYMHANTNGYGMQIAYPLNFDGATYIRWSDGTTWTDWKNVADGGNADTLDGVHVDALLQGVYDTPNNWWTLPSNFTAQGSIIANWYATQADVNGSYASLGSSSDQEGNPWTFLKIIDGRNNDAIGIQLSPYYQDGQHIYRITDNGATIKEEPWSEAVMARKNMFVGVCNTASAASEKAISINNVSNFTLEVGTTINVKFANTNTASNVTLNVNGTGAKQIWYHDKVYTDASWIVCGAANAYTSYMYDGECWVWMSNGASVGSYTEEKIAALEARIAALENGA